MNLMLGVSGSVAAYRSADLARELMRSGFTVRVCLTDAAQNFVSRALFEALTGQPCLQDTFEEPISGRMAHIDWAREADIVLIAPATANTINKIAAGVGDDMLTTIALATKRKARSSGIDWSGQTRLNCYHRLSCLAGSTIDDRAGWKAPIDY